MSYCLPYFHFTHYKCLICGIEVINFDRVKARRINIQRVERLPYAGVTPGSISKLSAAVEYGG